MSAANLVVNSPANGRVSLRTAILALMGEQDRERKRAELEEWQRDDANRLAAAWDRFKRAHQHEKRGTKDEPAVGTQAWLADKCGLKTQSAVSQYMNGKIALNLPMLLKFATALEVKPEAISPKLAEDLAVVRVGDDIFSEEVLTLARAIQAQTDPAKKSTAIAVANAALGIPTPVTRDTVEKAFYTAKKESIRAIMKDRTLFDEELAERYRQSAEGDGK